MVFGEEKMKLGLRIWILIIAILFSLLAIHPTFEKGVQITNIQFNSTASEYGLTSGEIIKSINGNQIQSLADYSKFMSETFPSEQEIKLIINTKENSYILFTNETPEITVKNLPKTKVQTGLDLQGGSRALVTTEEKINAQELNDLIAVTSNRLNVYGLSDMSIRPVSDLSGENYMLIEIAGSTPKELQNLISQQGEFEAKISNQTVFVGGNKDVTYVARTGENAGIYSCDNYDSGYVCQFRFSISLSEEAAQRQADATKNLSLSPENPGYLNEKLELYLDGKYVSDLLISKSLQGQVTTQIQISGSGTGATKQEAYENAEAEMKHLQTVL
jgi:preprotein translocase subunit SecD